MLERHLTIRWKLAGISALLTFAILGAFALVIGHVTTTRIRSDFSNQLITSADDLAAQLEISFDPVYGGVAKVTPNLETYAASEHAVIRVLTQQGLVIKSTPGAPDFGFPQIGAATAGDYEVAARSVVLRSGDLFSSDQAFFVQYARRLSDVEATTDRVRAFLGFGVLAGTALALIAGLLLARRAMSPIRALTTTTRKIAATGDPDQRVPIPRSEDEVTELARTLDDMLRALTSSRAQTTEALSRQRQFVADASHELRTPLTSVYANLELLSETLDGDEREAALSALRSTQRMKRLVADLLLLARADAQQERPHEPTDLSGVVLDAAAELGPVAQEHDLHVEVDGAVLVSGVRDELHRLVLNLVENALTHTPPGSRIVVRAAREGADAVLVVEDDGPGVDPEICDRLFERFVRSAGDHGGSTGLGLAIVKAVAVSHGGDVEVADAGGQSLIRRGTRFTVRIPALASLGQAPPLSLATPRRRPAGPSAGA